MSKIRRKEGLELRKNLPGYLLMAPAVIAVLALSVYPLFRGIYLSFLNYNLVRPNDPAFNTFAGLQNYIDIFKDKVFIQSIGNTVKWTVVNLVVQLVAAMLLALALNQKLKGRSVYRTLILVPWAVPHAIAAMTFTFLYNANVGIINILAVKLGMITESVSWLGNVGSAFWCVVLVAIWKGIPFQMIFILAALQGISGDVYESAEIDGASRWQCFWKITLPIIKEPLAISTILNLIGIVSCFNTIWLMTKGGWEASTTPADFARYVHYIMEELGSELHYVCTINEANMGIQVAAIAERYKRQMMAQMQAAQTAPKGGDSADGTAQVGINLEKMMENQKATALENMEVFGVEKVENFTSMRTREGDLLIMKAHELARKEIKALYPDIKVGLTLSLHDIQPQAGGEARAASEWDEEFLHYLPYIKEDDFLGVQNYTRSLIGPDGQLPNPEGAELTQMNYEFYPEALEHVLRRVAEDFHGDLYVTENGIATSDDTRRVAFIDAALNGVAACIRDGLPVKSYFHWSLLDNFEWQKGYSMTFGLIAVDRSTQTRHPKESLRFLGSWNR